MTGLRSAIVGVLLLSLAAASKKIHAHTLTPGGGRLHRNNTHVKIQNLKVDMISEMSMDQSLNLFEQYQAAYKYPQRKEVADALILHMNHLDAPRKRKRRTMKQMIKNEIRHFENTPEYDDCVQLFNKVVAPGANLETQFGWQRAKMVNKGASCEGKNQGKNLGVFKTANACAQAAAGSCTEYMWAKDAPSWGCRCCHQKSGSHKYWSIYKTNNCADGKYKAAEKKLRKVCKAVEKEGNLMGKQDHDDYGKGTKLHAPEHDRMTCDHLIDVMELFYYAEHRAYHKNAKAFCVLVVQDIVGEAEEPKCMEWMELVSTRLHEDDPRGYEKKYFFPAITTLNSFPAAAKKTCKILNMSPRDCQSQIKKVRGLKKHQKPDDYISAVCGASKHTSLLEFPGSAPKRMGTRRGGIHNYFHNLAKKAHEEAGKEFIPTPKPALKPALARGFNFRRRVAQERAKAKAKNMTNSEFESKYTAIRERLEKRAADRKKNPGADAGTFDEAVVAKGPPPNPPVPSSYTCSNGCADHTSRVTRRCSPVGICSKNAWTVEGSVSATAGLSLGAALGAACGYQQSADPWGYGLDQAYGAACGGVSVGTDVGSIGAFAAGGYMNKFSDVNGWSSAISVNIGVFFVDFGGGSIECCQSGWREPCNWCGAFGGAGVSLAPDSALPVSGSIDVMNCHTWMLGQPNCFMAKHKSQCGGSCFPEDARVQTADRGTIQMKDLRVGDRVLAASDSGELVYEDVYFFGHADPSAVDEYVELKLSSGSSESAGANTLQLSPRHFLPLCPVSGEPCEYGERVYKYAREVVPGDHLWLAAESPPPAASGSGLELARVASAARAVAKGKFNPYTLGGSIVVNGVLSSAHSEWILDDLVPVSATGHLPAIYQALFAPGRLLYALVGAPAADLLDLNSPIEGGHGAHGYGFEFLGAALAAQLAAAMLATLAACSKAAAAWKK